MNINSVGKSNVINMYAKNYGNKLDKVNSVKSKDTIEISSLARTLSEYDDPNIKVNNAVKIQELRDKINNGTYNVDAKLTAQSMLDFMKEGK